MKFKQFLVPLTKHMMLPLEKTLENRGQGGFGCTSQR